MEIGFNITAIKLHPDNHQLSMNSNNSNYGIEVLGIPIGTAEFIENSINDKLVELETERNNLINYNNNQNKYQYLHYCYKSKLIYYFRNIPPSYLKTIYDKYDKYKLQIFINILDNKSNIIYCGLTV